MGYSSGTPGKYVEPSKIKVGMVGKDLMLGEEGTVLDVGNFDRMSRKYPKQMKHILDNEGFGDTSVTDYFPDWYVLVDTQEFGKVLWYCYEGDDLTGFYVSA